MALNIADLFEHAADAVPDRMAVVCGDRHVTYRELDERTNRLAHHLASIGVRPDDHVGLYARNSIEALETLVAIYKLRARAGQHQLPVRRSRAALHVRRRRPGRAGLRPAVRAAGRRGAAGRRRAARSRRHRRRLAPPATAEVPGVALRRGAGAARRPSATSARAAATTSTCSTPAAPPATPRACCGGSEDVWRTLGGGIDFVTGEPLADEWDAVAEGAAENGLVKLCIAPLIHGNAQWAALMGLFAGETHRAAAASSTPHEVWRVDRSGTRSTCSSSSATRWPGR